MDFMSQINRRLFLQMASATGLAPALSSLPARAAVASGAQSTSQMLWASLGARAGSASNFAGLAGSLGVPPSASYGVYSKITATRMVAAQGAIKAGRSFGPVSVAAKTQAPALGAGLKASPLVKTKGKSALRINVRKLLSDALEDDKQPQVDPETEDNPAARSEV